MSFQNGENCEGLHEGRWFACTILSHEGEEYKVYTFENWSSRFGAPFHRVLPRDEKSASQPVKKRGQVVSKQASPQELLTPTTTSSPALPSLESYIKPQFFLVVHPDGVEIGCGDLVTVAPTCTDLAFIIVKIYQQDLREMMKAQKCEFSDGMVAKLDEQFNLTCPVTSVHKADSKISSNFTKLERSKVKDAFQWARFRFPAFPAPSNCLKTAKLRRLL